jgi:hypothetical protein
MRPDRRALLAEAPQARAICGLPRTLVLALIWTGGLLESLRRVDSPGGEVSQSNCQDGGAVTWQAKRLAHLRQELAHVDDS